MAGTVTLLQANPTVEGKEWVNVVEWVGPASYTTGGEAFSLKEAGFGKEAIFKFANVSSVRNLSEQAVYRPEGFFYNGTGVFVVDQATGLELASTKNLSKVKVIFEVHCTAN